MMTPRMQLVYDRLCQERGIEAHVSQDVIRECAFTIGDNPGINAPLIFDDLIGTGERWAALRDDILSALERFDAEETYADLT